MRKMAGRSGVISESDVVKMPTMAESKRAGLRKMSKRSGVISESDVVKLPAIPKTREESKKVDYRPAIKKELTQE